MNSSWIPYRAELTWSFPDTRIETIHGVLYLNPGSPGPRRFNLPVTLAILELTKSGLRPFIHHLDTANTD
jgi:membrane-associated phospholipid phosphatase